MVDDNSLSVEKRGQGQPPHQPTEQSINTAKAMASVGVQTKYIAAALYISEPTLIKHYQADMAQARGSAHMQVGKSLFQKAITGDTTAAIFYAKTQMGWKESKGQESSADDEDFADAIE